jgi:predicted metal-dependent hydrolase
MNALTVNDLSFELRRSSRRRTLEITVDRGGELYLSAPDCVSDAELRAFVGRKRIWIYRQLAKRDALGSHAPKKSFVDGEGFLYLGRHYRLRLVDDGEADSAVKLKNGRLLMPRSLASEGAAHLVRWYIAHARPWLAGVVKEYSPRMQASPTGIRVQDLGYRWGSCGKGQWLYFHWKTILLPPHVAQYVVVHELAHLHEPHHTPEFWRRVERAMPDYDRRRQWLAEHGKTVEGLG